MATVEVPKVEAVEKIKHNVIWIVPVVEGSQTKMPQLLHFRRKENDTLYAGQENLVTGHIEPGESFDAAAVREFHEELGDLKDYTLFKVSPAKTADGQHEFDGYLYLALLNDLAPASIRLTEHDACTQDDLQRVLDNPDSFGFLKPDADVIRENSERIGRFMRGVVTEEEWARIDHS